MSVQPTQTNAPAPTYPVQSVWGSDGFGFDDLVDIVNPLHHIPVVGTIYRNLSGDEIGMVPRMLGGFLAGGAVGLAAATVNAGFEAGTGKDVLEYAWASVTGEDAPAVPQQAYQAAAAAYAEPAAAPINALPSAVVAKTSMTTSSGSPAAPTLEPPAPATAGLMLPLVGASDRLLAEVEARSEFGGGGKTDLVA